MRVKRAVALVSIVFGSAGNGQHVSNGPKIVPSDPIEVVSQALADRKQTTEPRPTRLEIKPSGDAIYLVEEVQWDGDNWRTYQRAKVDTLSKDVEGVAIQGYDVMSYLEKRAEKGRKDLRVEYGGAAWWFVSEDHRRQFLLESQRFVPEYGGFCAYSVGRGFPATADPRVFAINEGKLYLFFDRAAKAVWEQSIGAMVAKGDRNWPKLHLQ